MMGGKKHMHTTEGRNRIGKATRQRLLGGKLSKEHKKKISLSLKGNRHRRGKKASKETKKRISEAVRKRYKETGSRGAPNWKGGRYTDCFGYVKVLSKNHPYANSRGYVREHRLVMEKKIGRYLKPNEIVHHLNRQKDDNREENLYITTRKEHKRVEVAELTCPKCKHQFKVQL